MTAQLRFVGPPRGFSAVSVFDPQAWEAMQDVVAASGRLAARAEEDIPVFIGGIERIGQGSDPGFSVRVRPTAFKDAS